MTEQKEPWGKPNGAPNSTDNIEVFKKQQAQKTEQNNQSYNRSSSDQPQSGPPDLEALLNDALAKIKGKTNNRSSSNSNNNSNNNRNNNGGSKSVDINNILSKFPRNLPSGKLWIPLIVIIAIILYIVSGIHTITEGQRGVIVRFGKYASTEQPGLNFYFPGIEKMSRVNVEQVNEFSTGGVMLTQDENIVNVGLTIQYRISDPVAYLFNVDDPKASLEEATDSALRLVIGHMTMDDILTTGRAVVRENTRQNLNSIIEPYNLGLSLVDVNFQSARPPEEVKDAFDDAIKAQEDEQRYIREAEAYNSSKEPLARGEAQKIIEAATAYNNSVILRAEGETARFNSLLPQYLENPQLFTTRNYLETLAKIYSETPKVVAENGMTINFLPLDKLLSNDRLQQVEQPPNSNSYVDQYNGGVYDKPITIPPSTNNRVGGQR